MGISSEFQRLESQCNLASWLFVGWFTSPHFGQKLAKWFSGLGLDLLDESSKVWGLARSGWFFNKFYTKPSWSHLTPTSNWNTSIKNNFVKGTRVVYEQLGSCLTDHAMRAWMSRFFSLLWRWVTETHGQIWQPIPNQQPFLLRFAHWGWSLCAFQDLRRRTPNSWS